MKQEVASLVCFIWNNLQISCEVPVLSRGELSLNLFVLYLCVRNKYGVEREA